MYKLKLSNEIGDIKFSTLSVTNTPENRLHFDTIRLPSLILIVRKD